MKISLKISEKGEIDSIFTAETEVESKTLNELGFSSGTIYNLSDIFKNHANFYHQFPFEYPSEKLTKFSGKEFNAFLERAYGINDIKEATQEIVLDIAQKIKNYVYSFIGANITMESVDLTSSFKVPHISLNRLGAPLMFFSGDECYLLKAEKVTNSVDAFGEQVYHAYTSQLQREVEVVRNEHIRSIGELEKRVSELQDNYFKYALAFLTRAFELGWVVENGKLVLKKKIVCTEITYHGDTFILPEKHKFYVQNVTINPTPRIHTAKAEKSFHSNIKSDGDICLGTLSGLPLNEFVMRLEPALKILNLNSSYGGRPDNEARKIMENPDTKVIKGGVIYAER